MPSIFRTPRKDKQLPTPPKSKSFTVPSRERSSGLYSPRAEAWEEFGQLPSTPRNVPSTPAHHNGTLTPPQSPRTHAPLLPSKYTFAPTRILPTTSSTSNSIDSFSYSHDEYTSRREYGFLGGVGGRVTLGLDQVGDVIQDVGMELLRRGLTIPLLFSTQALELSATRVKLLIQAYLEAVRSNQPERYTAWQRDMNFAKEHELAWMLRWALSRIVRIREGTKEICHGLIEWEVYEEWRGRERAASYPIDAFPFLASLIPAKVYHLVISPLLSLLSRFAAHSHLSGLTPHALSSLFAPLIFDIPTSIPCMASHATFVRAAYATEHLLLSYIRSTSQGQGLGVTDLPGRLKEWVSGYPAMVASDADLARATPRRGAKTVRCERISRTVRAYSKDLVATSELWSQDVSSWAAWDRVTLKSRMSEAGRPKFSSAWRRKMGIKETLPLPSSSVSSSEHPSDFGYGRARRPNAQNASDRQDKMRKADGEDEEARWGSLAGKEWSLFEEGGFDSASLAGKAERDMRDRLQFDLTESAKMSVVQKRQTMDWTEFAAPNGGFNRTDPILDVSLSFSSPLSTTISGWPKERDDLNRRLHKTQREATPFHFDTTPRIGVDIIDNTARPDQHGRVLVEEAFVDLWADWMMGGCWIDRDELTFKEANWALIEYKAQPSRPDEAAAKDPRADPRTSTLYILFEERVPIDYQLAIVNPKEKKTFATFFSTNKKKRANAATTKLPRSGSGWDDSDFDRMLLHRERTKKLTMSKSEPGHAAIWHLNQDHSTSPIRTSVVSNQTPTPPPRSRTRSNEYPQAEGEIVESKANFFSKSKDRVVRRVKTDEANREKAKIQRAKEVDFELHSASGISSPDTSPKEGLPSGKEKRDPHGEEKWMDILFANGARRMDRQDAAPPPPRPQAKEYSKPLGLPVSPHPPARKLSPSPPAPMVVQQIDPYAQYTSEPTTIELANFSSAKYTHSPETSESTDGHEVVTPGGHDGADVQRWPSSGKRKPVPMIVKTPSPPSLPHSPPVTTDDPSVPQTSEEKPAPPVKQRLHSPELLSPTPQRDTIHNIVDTYRDSTMTESSDWDTVSQMEPEEANPASADEPSQLLVPGNAAPGQKSVRERASFWENKDKVKEEEALAAPAPFFDLTPGREPSPARYKHGEPLQFVGEEEEEEY